MKHLLFPICSNYKLHHFLFSKKRGLQWIWACVCWGNQVWQRNHGSSQLGPVLPAREAESSWLQGLQSQGQWCGTSFINKPEDNIKIDNNRLFCVKALLNMYLFLSHAAWWRWPCLERAVQLAWFGQASGQCLCWCEPWVWDGHLYHPVPHIHWEDHHSCGQSGWVPAGDGGAQTWPLYRDRLSQTAEQQQQTRINPTLTWE